MHAVLRRIRGTLGMGLTWAFAWAFTGLMIGVSSLLFPWLPWARFFAVFDAPLPALGVPGFVGGVLFSLILGVAGRRRRFDQLSMPLFAVWGAIGGFLVALVPMLLGDATSQLSMLSWALIITGPLMLLCAASAAGSLWLARRAERVALGRGTEGSAAPLMPPAPFASEAPLPAAAPESRRASAGS